MVNTLGAILKGNLDPKIIRVGSIHLICKKVVQQHENENNPQRCHTCKDFGQYFDVLPEGVKAKEVCYLTPLPKKPT